MLIEYNIKYEKQKRFKWLGKQSLDFYLPEYNIAVECQGIQHFKPVEYFGGDEEFLKQIKRDNLKKVKCIKNNINILYYSDKNYNKEIINNKEKILKNILKYKK